MDHTEFSPMQTYQGNMFHIRSKIYRLKIMIRNAVKYLLISFPIDCEFHDGKGFSVFHPTFSQSTQFTATPHQNDGCEAPGCYEDHVTYS